MSKAIRKTMAWVVLACMLLGCVSALADSITVSMDDPPDISPFTEEYMDDNDTEVTFVLYKLAVPDSSDPSAWGSVINGLKLPKPTDGEWSSEQIDALQKDALGIIEAGSVPVAAGPLTVEYGKSETFKEDLEPGIYMGVAKDKPKRLTVKPFCVTLPSLSMDDPHNVTVEMEKKTEYVKPEPTSINGEKHWDDENDFSGIQPDHIDVQLRRSTKDTSPVDVGNPVRVEAPWTYKFENLPRSDADDNPYIYSVVEKIVPEGYATAAPDSSAGTSYDITNEHVPEKGALRLFKAVTIGGKTTTESGFKNAMDGVYDFTVEGPAGNRNSSVRTVPITITDGESNYTDLTDLIPGEYTIKETTKLPENVKAILPNDGKVTVTAGSTVENPVKYTVTNDHDVGGLKITKIVSTTGAESTAYDTYYFDITGPNGYKDRKAIKIDSNTKLTNSISVDGLLPGVYTVKEDTSKLKDRMKLSSKNNIKVTVVAGVDSTRNATQVKEASFTNEYTTPPPGGGGGTPTPTPPTTEEPTPSPTPDTTLNGRKTWNDEGNAHRTRPGSITVKLLQDGVEIDSKSVSGKGNNWSYSFGPLPEMDENGNTYHYSVQETPVSGYTTTVNGTTIINDLIPQSTKEYINLSGTKTWIDNSNEDGVRPNFITVRLLRNGVEVERRTVTAANGWQYSFNHIPKDDGYGNIYTYTIREDGVPGYFGRVNGTDLTNTRLPEPPPEEIPPYRTPLAGFEEAPGEEELEELVDLFGYGTPLWGELLGTGDETPIYPFVFGGIGVVALIAAVVLMLLGKKKQKKAA